MGASWVGPGPGYEPHQQDLPTCNDAEECVLRFLWVFSACFGVLSFAIGVEWSIDQYLMYKWHFQVLFADIA